MELTLYVDELRQELAVAAEAGGPEARALAERLTGPLESAARLVLLDALSAAAAEITCDLAPGSVDLRLRGREPTFVVTPPPAESAFDEPDTPVAPSSSGVAPDEEEGATARISLRLGERLKGLIEDAAGESALSVNAWLIRAATAALQSEDRSHRSERRAPRGGQHFTGWVR